MSDKSLIDTVPIELFLKFLTYMTTKEVLRCRGVCRRWKDIVDEIITREKFWRKRCATDFGSVLEIARRKSPVTLLWSDLYRSLSLWSKLSEAKEFQDEFCPASIVADEICGFTILSDGVIGVHKYASIHYYDIQTYNPVNRKPLIGNYVRYSENEKFILMLGFHLQLYLIKKEDATNAQNMFHNVKLYLLLDHCFYYIDMNDNLYKVCFDTRLKHVSSLLCKCHDSIMSLGYKDDQLQLLSYERNIYKLVDKKLVFVLQLGPTSNLLHQLNQLNLIEQLDWRIYIQWMYVLQQKIPPGPLHDILSMRIYGNVVFVGSNWGVLRIYYNPFTKGEFDLFNAQPVKQYNFMERFDCPVLSTCPILGIDAYEVEDGHLVFVAMPKKVAVLSFKHNYLKTCASMRLEEDVDLDDVSQEEGIKIITIA